MANTFNFEADNFNISESSGVVDITTSINILSGTGTPEGAVAAAVGSLYVDTAGSTSTTLYVKETGTTTSTGWVAK